MKTLLIAAGLMVAMIGGAPAAVAAPVGGSAPRVEAPQRDMRDGRRDDDRRGDRWGRGDRRGDRWGGRGGRGDRWGGRGGWGRRCHMERRHHRWIRVCGRR